MATLLYSLSSKTDKVTGLHEVLIRFFHRRLNQRAKCGIFIGNLYKETLDPNIIGKLSGHKEGSRAFARYRDIDDDMLTDLVSKLN